MESYNRLSKRQLLRAAGPAALWILAAILMSCAGNEGGATVRESNIKCADCPMRARYDRDPKSLLSRLWKWHTGWCPGWKAYLASLPDDERTTIIERYK